MLEIKKVIIFDLDGTLIDSIGVWNDIDIKLINTVGSIKFDNCNIGKIRDEKLKEYRNTPDAYLEYCGFLKNKYKSDKSKEEIKKLRYEIADYYLENVIDYKKDAENVLKYLKEKGFILTIASTTNENTIEKYRKYNKNIINKANFDDYFTLIYDKSSVKNIKPDPEVLYKTMDTLNVKKEECIVLEDSLVGVEAAKNAGIDTLVMYDKYSDENRDKINKFSKLRFNNFTELLDEIKKEV